MNNIRIIIFLLLIFLSIGCVQSGSKEKSHESSYSYFGKMINDSCNCSISSSPLSIADVDSISLDGKTYHKINPGNCFRINGFLRRDNRSIYYLKDIQSDQWEQKIIDFNANVKDFWFVEYSGNRTDKIMLVDKEYNSDVNDTTYTFDIEVDGQDYLQPSHAPILKYLTIGYNAGVIKCVYSGYQGYIVNEYSPACKCYNMTYEESVMLDSMYIN